MLDPDKLADTPLELLVSEAVEAGVTYFFVGGSLLQNTAIHEVIPKLKSLCNIPIILFPGSIYQIIPSADAIFFLSLISGRNPDLLIGNHVLAAPILKQTKLEVIPTAYILIDSGRMTTVNYISNTLPIPSDKKDIAVCTAIAGEMLGLRLIYMDGGSGAMRTIPLEMIESVSKNTDIPMIIGGGIRSAQEATNIWNAGAEIIVVGNAIEQNNDFGLMRGIGEALRQINA